MSTASVPVLRSKRQLGKGLGTEAMNLVLGREREAAFVDGEWQDDVMMAILDKEYLRMNGT
jgi:hypothetical protein